MMSSAGGNGSGFDVVLAWIVLVYVDLFWLWCKFPVKSIEDFWVFVAVQGRMLNLSALLTEIDLAIFLDLLVIVGFCITSR